MAKELDVHRALKFVSLDSHAANNSIVVTYEILIIIEDPLNGQELTRRNRLDNFQIKLSQLDSGAPLEGVEDDLDQVCENIFAKCRILAKERHRVHEELRLNLRYIINRSRQQLQSSASSPAAYRPPSSASIRAHSSGKPSAPGPQRIRSASTSRPASALSATYRKDSAKLKDKYHTYLAKELARDNEQFLSKQSVQFMLLVDQTLANWESRAEVDASSHACSVDEDTYLEGFYGEARERLASVRFMRKLVNDQSKLANAISNQNNRNLLVSALVRLLRDLTPSASDGVSRSEIESILYCLVKLDRNNVLRNPDNEEKRSSLSDLLKICIDNLEREIKFLDHSLKSGARNLMKSFSDVLNQIGLLVILIQQLIAPSEEYNFEIIVNQLICQRVDQFWSVLLQFISIFAHDQGLFEFDLDELNLTTDSQWKIYFVLSKLISISHSLSASQDCAIRLRRKDFSSYVAKDLTKLLDKLQSLQLKSDPATAAHLYELELSLIKFICNLTIDQRLLKIFLGGANKSSDIKEDTKFPLLKCVLRNLVCLLATSSGGSALKLYTKSDVMLVPFIQLYRLSCNELIRSEILKSRVIIKCMFDYLLDSSREFLLGLSKIVSLNRVFDQDERQEKVNRHSDISQILLEVHRCEHFILTTWINLTSRSSLLIESENEALDANIKSYFGLTIDVLKQFIESSMRANCEPEFLLVYLHVKLARNMTTSMEVIPATGSGATTSSTSDWLAVFSSWIAQLTPLMKSLLISRIQLQSKPILVECLGMLSNILSKQASIRAQGVLETGGDEMDCLLACLRDGPLQDIELLDNEDDDLLIVFINFVSTLAITREICNAISLNTVYKLLQLTNFVLKSRSNDLEMNCCVVLALIRLIRHPRFIYEFVNILTSPEEGAHTLDQENVALDLVAGLSELLLVQETGKKLDLATMANSVLSLLMQAEEQLSLSEPCSALIRFEKYNCKWLAAIRKQTKNNFPMTGTEQQINQTSATNRLDSADSNYRDSNEEEFEGDDDLVQLRTINPTTISEFERDSEQRDLANSDSEHYEDEFSDALEVDDQYLATKGPDSRVVDAESMIGHLVSR